MFILKTTWPSLVLPLESKGIMQTISIEKGHCSLTWLRLLFTKETVMDSNCPFFKKKGGHPAVSESNAC
jgi:hypothetical protein